MSSSECSFSTWVLNSPSFFALTSHFSHDFISAVEFMKKEFTFTSNRHFAKPKLKLQFWVRLALISFSPTNPPPPTPTPGENTETYPNWKFSLYMYTKHVQACFERSTTFLAKDPHRKATSHEDDLTGRRPQWNITSMDTDLNGRRPQWKTNSVEE